MPEVSGNTVNGLGEAEFRRPTHVYWHDPETLHHGEMPKWFYTQNTDHEGIRQARADREKIHAIELPPVNADALQQSAADWTSQLQAHAATLDFELFGITAFNPEWTFDGCEVDRKWIIMIGVAHDYEQIKKAPGNESGAEVIRQYGRASKASKDGADVLDRGHQGIVVWPYDGFPGGRQWPVCIQVRHGLSKSQHTAVTYISGHEARESSLPRTQRHVV